MSRPILQTIVSGGLRAFDRISAPARAEAHCDIPCGIYDPHLMQIGALTVLRMTQLVEALGDDAAKTKSNLSRYIEVKEEHAELVKRDYFARAAFAFEREAFLVEGRLPAPAL